MRNQIRLHVGALTFFLLITVAVTWPLVCHLADRVPGWYVADNYEYLWKMWWFEHAIVDLHQSPLVAPHIFYPQGFPLAHAELTPLHTLIGLPLTWLWGEIPTYNIFAMLSFILAGWATFYMILRATGNAWAGLLAGVLYILTPYHVVRYGGILPLMAVEGIPVFLLGIEGWAGSRQLRWIAVSGLGFLLASWGSIYYAFGLLCLAPVYALARFQPARRFLADRRTWTAIGIFVLIVFIALVPLSLPYLQLARQLKLEVPLDDVDFWSASPTDYLVPPGLHPLWGSWVRQKLLTIPGEYPQIALEFVLGVGFIALLFASYAVRRRRGGLQRALFWLAITAFVLSLGPRLHLGRHPVVLPAPKPIANGFHLLMDAIGTSLPSGERYRPLSTNGVTIPLPALFIRWLLPPLRGMRAWNRFAAFTALSLSLLAGLGYADWIAQEVNPKGRQQGSQIRRRLVGLVVLSLAMFELWPQAIPLQVVQPRPVDQWLAAQSEQFSIMELPLTSALSAPQMLYSRHHGKRTTFAYGTYFPYWYRRQYPELEGCPGPACLDLLRSWDVQFILLNLSDAPRGPEMQVELDQAADLRRVTKLANIVIYELLR